MFAGENFEAFDVQDVLPAPMVAAAVRQDEDAIEAFIARLLKDEKRKQKFRHISTELDWREIWRNRSKIIMKEWDV